MTESKLLKLHDLYKRKSYTASNEDTPRERNINNIFFPQLVERISRLYPQK